MTDRTAEFMAMIRERHNARINPILDRLRALADELGPRPAKYKYVPSESDWTPTPGRLSVRDRLDLTRRGSRPAA